MSSKLILCNSCNGKGLHEREELICYHNGDYKYWTEECGRCEGSGILIETIEIYARPYIKETKE